ncbi:MAG TPA: hypothetical protein PKD90_09745, partial [Phnomibacter sp.]|nr:hypothetical protein [Phnomibacter sp.]
SAHKIVLAMDAQRKTFTGTAYYFEEDFKTWVQQLDTAHKIEWLEEPFYEPGMTPQQVVLKKRNRLLQKMQPANWYIQLDADEYFLNFEGFVSFLRQLKIDPGQKLAVSVNWKTIFKELPQGYLMIAGRTEAVEVATNFPAYTRERGHDDTENISTNFVMLHQSWARSEEEIKTKIENWSHAHDFDTACFYCRWQSCNASNYKQFINFHPIHHLLWPRLAWVKASHMDALIAHYQKHPPKPEKPNPKPLSVLLKSTLKKLIKPL